MPDRIAPPAKLRLIAIVGLALVLRLLVVYSTVSSHADQLATWFFAQASELAALANSLLTGHGLSSPFSGPLGGPTGPSAFLSPGYPVFVAAIFALFHPYSSAAAIALMLLQALFGAATVLVLMLVARRVFGNSTANLAGMIGALCPPALFLPTLFWETTLSVLLAITLVLVALRCADKPTMRNWLVAGLLASFALATNPSLLPIVVCGLGWAVYQTRSQALAAPALGLLLCVVLCAPWTIRNYRQFHAFIPFRSNMGYELWQGNRFGADGLFVTALHPNTSPQEFDRYRSLGELAYMKEKSSIATQAIKNNPGRFLQLTLKRSVYFWTGIVRQSAVLIVVYISVTTVLGFAGLWRLWRENRGVAILFLLPLVLFPLPYYVTHPDFRFRLVLDPMLIALTACLFSAKHSEPQNRQH